MKKRLLKRIGNITSGIVVATVLVVQSVAPAFATDLIDLLGQGVPYYIPGDVCNSGAVPITGGGTITLDNQQESIAKTVIGIAKTEGLTQKAALIAFMTIFQESHFHNWANNGAQLSGSDASNIKTFSGSNPNSAGFPPGGGDHGSVGPFQQQVTTGWSTFSGSAVTQDTVWQIMGSTKSDQFAAYSAEAFFGSPPNATLPSGLANPGALKKGLQNKVPNYNDASVSPGVAAQTVQVSAFPDAYNKWQTQAQQLVDQYWNSSQPIPLPVPFTGGGAPATTGNPANCDTSGGLATTGKTATINKMLSMIVKYAWPVYCHANASSCPGRPGGATDKNPAYAQAVAAGGYNGDTCYGGGVDCGAFVTHVMRDSGADPDYNKSNGPTSAQLAYLNANSNGQGNKKYQKVSPSQPLEAGDIAVKDGHTWIYIGNSLQGAPFNFRGDSASASQCGRAPMAGPADTRGDYEWFRIVI